MYLPNMIMTVVVFSKMPPLTSQEVSKKTIPVSTSCIRIVNVNTEPGKHCTPKSLITMQLMCYFLPMWDYFHLSH